MEKQVKSFQVVFENHGGVTLKAIDEMGLLREYNLPKNQETKMELKKLFSCFLAEELHVDQYDSLTGKIQRRVH
ncbi:MAG: hypothetical protein LBJ31_04395 [Treponema sp.]|nr:hypothetical protein [Treponema sp.]